MARKPANTDLKLPMPIWDLPTRLFHWLLPILIATSYISVKTNHMTIHLVSGYSMGALLIFRLAWGFLGSDTSRFGQFLKHPLKALQHLAHLHRREPDHVIGHNEAGGWMVLGLLGLLALQVLTGLSANDDGAIEGPLVKYVGKEMSDRLSSLHGLNFKLIMLAASLHVLAVILYAVLKGQNLLRPMITGRKHLPAATPAPRMVHPVAALVVLGIAIIIMAAVATIV